MTDWAPMLRLALSLGLQPEWFWRLSMREWRMLTDRTAGPAPMGRETFEQMAEAWPDE